MLTSDLLRAWPVSIAALGAATFLLALALAAAGDRRRWRGMPWMVLALGVLLVPLGAASTALVVLQPVAVGAWCLWCLIAAAAALGMIPLALDEVVAAAQVLRRERRAGRSAGRALWRGVPDLPPIPAEPHVVPPPAAIRAPWPLYLAAALGVWVLASPGAAGAGGAQAASAYLAGALVVAIAVIAISECGRPLRLVNVALGAWIAASPWLGGATSAGYGAAVAGALIAAANIPRGPIRQRHGRYDHVAAWPGRAVSRPA